MKYLLIIFTCFASIFSNNVFATTTDTIYVEGSTTTRDTFCIQEEVNFHSDFSEIVFSLHANNSGNFYLIQQPTCLNTSRSITVGLKFDTVCVVAYDTLQSLTDTTIFIVSNLPQTQTLYLSGEINTSEVVCLPVESGMFSLNYSIVNCGHENNSGNVWTAEPTVGCITIVRSQVVGVNLDTVCIILNDSTLGLADTTIFIVTNTLPDTTLLDTIFACVQPSDSITLCDLIFEHGVSGGIQSQFCDGFTTLNSPFGTATIMDGCLFYTIADATNGYKDTLCVITYDTLGRVDTTIFIITVDSACANISQDTVFIIQGYVYADTNENCTNDNEFGIPFVNVTCTINQQTYYTTTNSKGYYVFFLFQQHTNDLASIQAQLPLYDLPNSNFGNCDSVYQINLSTSNNSNQYNFGINFDQCSYLTVEHSYNSVRRCSNYNHYIYYRNIGLLPIRNAYIDVQLDAFVQFISSPIRNMSFGNNTYRFFIDSISPLAYHSFYYEAFLSCDAVLGQTHCNKIVIFPDTICLTNPYNGSIINAFASCAGDSVQFELKNEGGNMQNIKKYIVIEDDVMRISNNYQLLANQSIFIKIKNDSTKTYRITADREDVFPSQLGDKFATAFIQCNSNRLNNSITQFPNYDNAPNYDIACFINVGSYDPNDKHADITGYGNQHFIENTTNLNYHINFQNTGTDTAFKVIVVDTIQEFLDINSIRSGNSSHHYVYEQIAPNVIRFVFDSINLVDSFQNEPLSHGFVEFSIQQKPNNPDGTKILNTAAIYFDNNDPVITNQVFHTIGRDFIQVQLINSTKNSKYNVKEVKILPNPFRDQTQIIVESNELKNAVLVLMNLEGQIIKTIPSSNNNMFTIYREDLANGMYLFKILEDNNEVTTGKLIAQ